MTEEELPFSTSDRDGLVKLRIGESGASARPASTVFAKFDEAVKKFGSKPSLRQKIVPPGKDAKDTPWTTWTWSEYRQNVDKFAKSLLSLGFEPFDSVNIIGFNAPEWLFANFGAIAAGGIAAGIYATNGPEACKYISNHSKAKVIVVEGTKQLEKFIKIAADLPELKALVMYGPEDVPSNVKETCSVPVYCFSAFLDLGKEVGDADLQVRVDSQKPNQTCSLIYTSGTTGNPKAAMITHDNIVWVTQTLLSMLPRELDNDDCEISYLPLSHIAAQMLDMFAPMMSGSQIYFAQPDALRGSLGATLKEVRPTLFFGVPRVWEKIYAKMQEIAKSVTGLKKTISTWAKAKSTEHHQHAQFGQTGSSPLLYPISKKILKKIHVALGLDRCIMASTGAAPIEDKILHYFASIDMPVLELFGQSECTGPHTVNFPDAWKIGTCGRPLLGTESKIDESTGELCYRGRHIFAGYMGMPDKTAETIDSEGWLHSGDIAKFDDNDDPRIPKPSGFMSITGRIKELIITAGGENIAPVPIEEEFKAAMPALANCMAIGDKRKFLSILLCLQVEIDDEGIASEKLTEEALLTSKRIGSKATTTADAKACDKWKKYFDDGLEVANSKATSRAQKIAKWSLLSTDFTEKGGELTPTLKLKRSVAADKYSDAIEAIYA